MVTREDGFVALEHYNTNPKTVKLPDGTVYNFVPRYNVCMAWVSPEHVEVLLKIKAKICCGKRKPMFHYTSQINVNLWTTGHI